MEDSLVYRFPSARSSSARQSLGWRKGGTQGSLEAEGVTVSRAVAGESAGDRS